MLNILVVLNHDQDSLLSPGPHWLRRFFSIWLGQAVSLFGSQLVQFALIWHLTQLTGSATVLAMASLVGLLPMVVAGPFIGALVDRWNRRMVMIAADATVALATLGLAFAFAAGPVETPVIYAALFVRAVAGSFHGSASSASMTMLVPKKHFARIQGMNQAREGALGIIAAPVGAVLIAVLPVQHILAIDVVTAVLAIVPLLVFSVPQPERHASTRGRSVLADMREGLHFVVSWRGLTLVIGMAVLINFLLSPAFALLPILVSKHFSAGALELGWMNAAFGVGVVIGGVALGAWGGFKRKISTAMLGVAGIGAGTLLISLAPPGVVAVGVAGMALAGVAQPIANGSLGAIIQGVIPPAMQGRVFSLMGAATSAMAPLGLAIAGPVADLTSVPLWYAVGGAVCLIMAGLGAVVPAIINIESERAPDTGHAHAADVAVAR